MQPLHELARDADTQVDELGFRLYDKGLSYNEAHDTAARVQNIADDLVAFVARVHADFPHTDPDLAAILAEQLAVGLGLPADPGRLITAQMAWRSARDAVASGQMRAA